MPMHYENPMTVEEKYDKLVHMVDAMLREARGRMEVDRELYMLERDESRAARYQGRSNKDHEVFKTLKTLDDYIDLLEQVPTSE